MPTTPIPLLERFWPKVQKTESCWLWTASLTKSGYGQINVGVQPVKMRTAHSVAYEALVGPVPEGMELDHLCRNRACVNPAHLEPVTHAENCRRGSAAEVNRARQLAKMHCSKGHPLSGSNLYVDPRGKRCCRTCRNDATARHRGAESRAT